MTPEQLDDEALAYARKVEDDAASAIFGQSEQSAIDWLMASYVSAMCNWKESLRQRDEVQAREKALVRALRKVAAYSMTDVGQAEAKFNNQPVPPREQLEVVASMLRDVGNAEVKP